jgi:hypothetical protein
MKYMQLFFQLICFSFLWFLFPENIQPCSISDCDPDPDHDSTISFCEQEGEPACQASDTGEDVCPLTVWVHGTRLFSNPILWRFFHKNPGLAHINEIDQKHHTNRIGTTLFEADSKQFPKQSLYRFGWSGKLSARVREESAEELYTQLCILSDQWRAKHLCAPAITLITHSHGGNVALNLAKIHQKRHHNIRIVRLVLLACPVQKETCEYILDPLFEQVYSLYSSLDLVQVVDPQGLHHWLKQHKVQSPFFSERTFMPHNTLRQAKIKCNGRGLFHAEFMFPHFLATLPAVLSIMDTYNPPLIHIFSDNNKIKVCAHSVTCPACIQRKKRRRHVVHEIEVPLCDYIKNKSISCKKRRRFKQRRAH